MKKKKQKRTTTPAAGAAEDRNVDSRGQHVGVGAIVQSGDPIGQVLVAIDGCYICRGLNDEAEAHFATGFRDAVLLSSGTEKRPNAKRAELLAVGDVLTGAMKRLEDMRLNYDARHHEGDEQEELAKCVANVVDVVRRLGELATDFAVQYGSGDTETRAWLQEPWDVMK
jgi:hypothetical protein